MLKFILCQGISGSGKTTWARHWVEEDPIHRIRLNYDDIRCMLGKYWVTEREPLVQYIFKQSLDYALSQGYNIVIDNMNNLNPKHIKEYQDLIEKVNTEFTFEYSLEFKLFDTPVEECIRRDSLRENPIGEEVIRQQWRRYRNYIIWQSIKNIPKLNQNPDLPHCVIVDMDGTLFFNTSGRPFYGDALEPTDILKDEPVSAVITLVKAYQETGKAVIGLSGREDTPKIRACTIKQCENVGIHLKELFLRPVGSTTRGDICKREIFNQFIRDKYYVDVVLDDSSKVVKMWRELGLVCLQPNEGKF